MASPPSSFRPLIFLLLLLLPLLQAAEKEKLELVQLLYRHGDRSPISLYATDPHRNVSLLWPMGLGQLTKEGKAMHYKLGRWLRARYDNLVGPMWVPEEVYTRSTDTDRTLMSAACNLAAFYYPEHNDERFETDLPWLPVPIHTVPQTMDKLLCVDLTCPKINVEVTNLKDLPEVKKVMHDSQDLFQFLSEKAGEDVRNITAVAYLYDTLMIEAAHNLSLPVWTKDVFSRMEAINEFSFTLEAYTKELKRLRGGPLIKEFQENMKKKIAGDLSNTKMFMYSAHDINLSIVLEALGVYNGLPPPYAATFLLELYNIKNKHFVKMFYRNDTAIEEAAHPLLLPGCSMLCPLEDWLTITSSVVPQDWNRECQAGLPFDMPLNTFAVEHQ